MHDERVFIGLGSNLGDREGYLQHALRELEKRGGRIAGVSGAWESPAWGFRGQAFLNQVAELRTDLHPRDLLRALRDIEALNGRLHGKYGFHDRSLDLDVLLFGNRILNTKILVLPHPGIASRRFVLEPLAQLAPNLVLPGTTKTVETLRLSCTDKSAGAWL